MPQYKIYAGEPMGFPTVPVIVTTAYANHGGYPRGEWFLAIPDDRHSLFALRIVFAFTSFPEGPFQLNEDTVLREALDEAKLRLRRYLFEARDPQNQPSFREADIREDNRNLFMHYWLRGECMDQLERIFRITEFAPLQTDLQHVLELQRPERRDL